MPNPTTKHASKPFSNTSQDSETPPSGREERQTEFSRLFPGLPAWSPPGVTDDELENYFLNFAEDEMFELRGKSAKDIVNDRTLREDLDRSFNSKIPAGYTYFGQFVDHDLTHDRTKLKNAGQAELQTGNFRTPRLDLDSVYGNGPFDDDDRKFYEFKGDKFTGKFLIDVVMDGDTQTKFRDLHRDGQGIAQISDERNDENTIVAQIHLAFLLAHNNLVDQLIFDDANDDDIRAAFLQAKKTLTWLYQWIVWNDFLSRITMRRIYDVALRKKPLVSYKVSTRGKPTTVYTQTIGATWEMGFEEIFPQWNQEAIPEEFTAAAYRFGHSMVRNGYQTNIVVGVDNFIPLFIGQGDNEGDTNHLGGGRKLTKERVLQWDWFLPMTSSRGQFPQKARKIDTKLANSLALLPPDGGDEKSINAVLAARNLVRGVRLGLPSGPDVARSLGIQPIELDGEGTDTDALWYYILKEAGDGRTHRGERLGEVGSFIVCSVFAGILKRDSASWIIGEPNWTPSADRLLEGKQLNVDGRGGAWTLGSIIRLAKLPVSRDDFLSPPKRGRGGSGGGGIPRPGQKLL